jgi:lipopolysaccharide export system protein LptA
MIFMTRIFSRSDDKRCAIVSAAALAVGIALVATGAAIAQSAMQGVPNAMQGFSQNRDQPIQIEAASLEMRDKKKEATFAGNVKVIQGDTTMTSKTLVVFYDSGGDKPATPQPAPAKGAKSAPMQSATPGPGGSSSIKRLEARGNVVVTQKDQVVTGDTAVFDTKTNLITMLGGSGQVVLTQCKNVLRGDRLMVDMTTGVSRVESDNGRVQALLPQGGGSDCGQGGQGGKPGGGSPLQLPGASKPK